MGNTSDLRRVNKSDNLKQNISIGPRLSLFYNDGLMTESTSKNIRLGFLIKYILYCPWTYICTFP